MASIDCRTANILMMSKFICWIIKNSLFKSERRKILSMENSFHLKHITQNDQITTFKDSFYETN